VTASEASALEKRIHDFFDYVEDEGINLYNEFSLQHELGFYLRGGGPRVEFERNVEHFGLEKKELAKKEIDIALYSDSPLVAIEVKYPRRGRVPESMFDFVRDIAFLEQLVSGGFKRGYFLALVDDRGFYSGTDFGIYSHFRYGKPITGAIRKPTGREKDKYDINVAGCYTAEWVETHGGKRYCLVAVDRRGYLVDGR
jgi:hypothetical protein